MAIKKRDDEKPMTIIVCAIFTIAMLIVLFTAGNVLNMGLLLSILAFGSVIMCVVSWVVLLKNIYNPNYDYWRWLCIVFALGAIITIMGHRATWLEDKQLKADTEQPVS
jgi:glycerol-3-phosphate acyltransferase PlsY